MEGIATPIPVAPGTTTPGVVTGSTTGQSVQFLYFSNHACNDFCSVDLRAPSPLEAPRTPPTTTTTREPAPPTTREARIEARQCFLPVLNTCSVIL